MKMKNNTILVSILEICYHDFLLKKCNRTATIQWIKLKNVHPWSRLPLWAACKEIIQKKDYVYSEIMNSSTCASYLLNNLQKFQAEA